jgi:hypothetical protein
VKAKVEKGWVTLTGEVDWHYQQDAAASDVRGLWGVIGVSNEITIKPKPNTSKIRDNILVALHRSWFDPATINVSAHGPRSFSVDGDIVLHRGRRRRHLRFSHHRQKEPA